MPLERLRLHETGVGYFERRGALVGKNKLELRVPAGQVDDALKTLVVLNGDGQATVTSIAYPSSVSPQLGRALAGLPGDASVPLGFLALLNALRGAHVEIGTARGTMRGRLLGVLGPSTDESERCVEVDRKNEDGKGQCQARRGALVTLLSDAGEIRRLPTSELDFARPLDGALLTRLRAMAQSSSRNARVERTLSVVAQGGTSVRVGYVAETAVWRSSYRLVLGNDARARIQGWALVHNDTEEDWRQVRLEISSGRPDSFLLPLAAPRYARRELAPSEELSTVPQLLEHSLDTVQGDQWGDEIEDTFGAGGLGLSGIGEGGGGRGEGIGLGQIGTQGHGAAAESESSALSVGSLASVGQTGGVEAGALFNYAIATPLDLGARSSALVPFLDRAVQARRIAWFEQPGSPARSAVHVVNDTSQTLPAGALAVFADGGFAGETQLGRTKPTETRIVRFGIDLDVELTEVSRRSDERPELFCAEGGELVEHFVRKHVIAYRIVNRSLAPRRVYLELDLVSNARVRGADELAYDPERKHALAEFAVGARAQREPGLVAEEGLRREHKIAQLTAARLREWAGQNSVPRTQRTLLEGAAQHRERAERARENGSALEREIAQAAQDEERVRKDLAALGADRGKAGERLEARLLQLEQSIRALRAGVLSAEAEQKRERRLCLDRLAQLGSARDRK